jgi:hypothetical protein
LPIHGYGVGRRGERAMILQGSIERFDLGSVLQFLAQNAATGILEIRDFEEHGHIYLVKGHLEAISLPVSDDRLGVYLVKNGALVEGQLARVLVEEADQDADGRRPLGQRLVEKGFVSEGIVRQAMCRLTVARMFELAHWRSGVFAYYEPEEMPEFRIAIQGNVQELLLQAQVRIDHGERPRKRTEARQEGLCYQCPVTDCSPSIKLKYLKKDMCLWRKMSVAPDARTEPAGYGAGGGYTQDDRTGSLQEGTWVQF